MFNYKCSVVNEFNYINLLRSSAVADKLTDKQRTNKLNNSEEEK